eukprot:gnl/MRDRNA2_/MRDRNA2_135895_c0_seq1.p1 gnl/MRDRNA2_/MRDRNA2_135895_c0~~gnl/MRDRNA2_/MRDRNA2_135895_c0_seq1.p1  ORF type:complete len:563 (+),score=97.50 gnl/MRDRNA2_/MRDRNA2_135895_c0_seq1:115-1803(+)
MAWFSRTDSDKRLDLYVGQEVFLRGTGGRWGDNQYPANVVEVHLSSDSESTVKVQYRDGGFKRFPLEEFQDLRVPFSRKYSKSAIPRRSSPDGSSLFSVSDLDAYVGQDVVLRGSGRRWGSNTYSATIVNIRGSDSTVKVQYRDGGFKRFPLATFENMRVDRGLMELDYGSQAYEWYFENYAPDLEFEDPLKAELFQLRREIAAAQRAGDDAASKSLREKFQRRQNVFVTGQRLREELITGIQQEDFRRAAEAQEALEKFKMESQRLVEDDFGSKEGSSNNSDILVNAGRRALGNGVAGAAAMLVQVTSLMWIRTIMNYQYRYGTGIAEAISNLHREGGLLRFYRGYLPAVLQGPLARFGDTAANAGAFALLDSNPTFAALPAAIKTLGASGMAATWRILVTPLDTIKTILQVEGKDGLKYLSNKAKRHGPFVYYHGASAAATATFASHYPWFAIYNTLQEVLPQYQQKQKKLVRDAGIGFCSSVVSDTAFNSLRVIKTYRQTATASISYAEAVSSVVQQDGYAGLFGRGLKTRIIANGMQGLMFSVMWKLFEEEMQKRRVF